MSVSEALMSSESKSPSRSVEDGDVPFGPLTQTGISRLLESVSASSATDLLAALVLETADAEKTKLERIKLMDKLLNTLRYMLETKVKIEDTPLLDDRVRRLETRVRELNATMDPFEEEALPDDDE
jgi:hypothetical protein